VIIAENLAQAKRQMNSSLLFPSATGRARKYEKIDECKNNNFA
jgi:hypothetical protein